MNSSSSDVDYNSGHTPNVSFYHLKPIDNNVPIIGLIDCDIKKLEMWKSFEMSIRYMSAWGSICLQASLLLVEFFKGKYQVPVDFPY